MTPQPGEQGFTLMEALAGLLILTLGLTALFSAFSGSIVGLRRSERRDLAVETARSLMEKAGVTSPLAAGVREGRSAEGFPWRVEIRARRGQEDLRTQPRIEGFWVDVTVTDGFNTVQLTSLKVAQGP